MSCIELSLAIAGILKESVIESRPKAKEVIDEKKVHQLSPRPLRFPAPFEGIPAALKGLSIMMQKVWYGTGSPQQQ